MTYYLIDKDKNVTYILPGRYEANLWMPYLAEVVGTDECIIIPCVYTDELDCDQEEYNELYSFYTKSDSYMLACKESFPDANIAKLEYIKMSEAEFDEYLNWCIGRECKVLGGRIKHKYRNFRDMEDYVIWS